MNETQKKNFRLALLRVLEANRSHRFGLELPALGLFAGAFGFPAVPDDHLRDALAYLVKKGLAEELPQEISPALQAWRITDAGAAYLDEH